MKLFCILLVFFFFDVDAQRRSLTRHEVTSNEQPIRSRGRSRFSNPEYIQLAEETNRRPSSRRRPDPTIAPIEKHNYPSPITPSSTVSYAVEEIVDETDPQVKPRVITENNFEIPNIPQKSLETEDSLKDISSETNNPPIEEVLPNIKLENNGASSSQERIDANLPRLTEKVVPITRNNVRNGVSRSGNERKTEPRNGGSRNGNSRGSRNGYSRVAVESDIPSVRNGLSRPSNSEDSISKLDLLTETNPLSPSSRESLRDENEIRKEIVRNSMPKLPQPIGIPTELNKPILPKKTIKKTLRTRPITNTRTEETVSSGSTRSRANSRVVESDEAPSRSVPSARNEQAPPVLRATISPRVIEEYIPPSRGRTAGAPRELEYTPSQRTRASITPRTEESVVTARSRTRGLRRPVESTPTIPSRSSQRVNRRRPESATTGIPISRRGPSVFSSTEESFPSRSRTGRKITQDDGRRSRSDTKSENKSKSVEAQSSDQVNSVPRKGSRFRKDETLDTSSTSRNRFNGRPPLNIDESKLEVLPLFEGETKIVSQPGSRSNQLQVLISSATESENNVLSPPNDATATISPRSDISHTKKEISDSHFKRKPYRKTEIKESVIISQVTEVTSKKTITRKPVSRPGSRKFADIKSQIAKAKSKNGLTSSEEDISESDNYPEPFKSLIQSKKHSKESRSSESSTISKKAEEIVSSSAAPRLALVTPTVPSRASTASNKFGNIFENEVKPNTLTPPTLTVTRKRFTTSKNLEHLKSKKATTPIRNKVSRSTLAPPKEPRDHKFHSKFNAVTKNENVVISKPFKSTSAKGLPNRKSKLSDKNALNKTRNSLEIGNSRSQFTASPISKTSRYSSRYRSNAQSRSARTSTPPPAYIPTIPNVKPYSPPVKSQEDPELGLEYISFDAPVRSLSSANLINEEFRPSSDANSNSLDSKQENGIKTTEKPTSIIERIINSITGINLTTDPTAISPTTTANTEPTKSSAILSLAPKKVAKKSQSKDNLTQQKTKSSKRDASTSEKPTTVIQRILNSLSAIQAATTTETTTTLTTDSSNFANKQVGSNFNTLSSGTTTPSSLDRETASFSSTLALSTTINPLVVFDAISDEQVLQKRTIGKLLEILNSLTTQHPDSTKTPDTTKLVYVTPKIANYFYNVPSSLSAATTLSVINNSIVPTTETVSEAFTSSAINSRFRSEDITTEAIADNTESTTEMLSSSKDTPLSISLGFSTPREIVDNVLFTPSPMRNPPVVMNMNLMAPSSTTASSANTVTTMPSVMTSDTPTSVVPTTMVTSTSTTSETKTQSISSTSSDSRESTASSVTTTSIPSTTIQSSRTHAQNSTEQNNESSATETATAVNTMTTTSISSDTSSTPGSSNSTENSEINSESEAMMTTENFVTETIFSYPSTIPTFPRFEVSPESVAIFSVNDLLSNSITPDDFLTTTVSIPSRMSDNFLTNDQTTPDPFETSTFRTQERLTITSTETLPTTNMISTEMTEKLSTSSVVGNDTQLSMNVSNEATTASSSPKTSTMSSRRNGKLLQKVEDNISNSIDTSSMGPDYFIFAVLPNNTILRKRPTTYFNETPFVIVGVYPNNTIIRKFLNGTLVPMEPVIRVRGFDTRANPPPLPDITSNQVTPDQGDTADNPNRERVNLMSGKNISGSVNSTSTTTIKPVLVSTTPLMSGLNGATTVTSVENDTNITTSQSSNTVTTDNVFSSSSPVSTTILPSITELLNGKTLQAFNSLVNTRPPMLDSTTKVVDNTVNEIQETNTPPTKKVVSATPLSIVSNTGTPSFLNTILSTLQSIGTTRVPKIQIPTTLAPLRFSSTYRAPVMTTMFGSITSVPTTTFESTATTTSATETMTTSASRTTTSVAPKLTTTPLTTSTFTTTTSFTTTPPTTKPPMTTTVPTTTSSIPVPSTTTPTTTITVPPPITTTISLDEKDQSTQTPFTSKPFQTSRAGKAIPQSTVFPYFNPSEFPLLSIFSTERPRRTNGDRAKDSMNYSTNSPTTMNTKTTTVKDIVTTEDLETLLKKPIDSIKPKKRLTEQQKKDLETVRQLEREQAAILKQLSFLTNLNLNANSFNNAKSSDNLANRIIALAKEKDGQKLKATTTKPTTTTSRTTTTTAKPKTTMEYKDDAERERMKQIENLIRLLNMNGVTPSPNKESTYGTSNDAILAALLKDRGIGPSTPKQLAEQIEQLGFFTQTNEITTKPTRKRKPTTQPTRGPIMQRLSWLLNALAPAPTKTPPRKPKATTRKPKPKKVEQDLTTEVTEMTPVVTSLPTKNTKATVSQDDIQKLIKQLEAIQRDPSAARNLDLSSFRSLQNLNKDNVQVFMPGSSGISQREITKPITRAATQMPKTTSTIQHVELEVPTVRSRASVRAVRTSTFSPTPVSNSVLDDVEEEVTPQRGKVTLPPVKLRPVSGVSDDAGSLVRGRLLSAAVNVTRAISGFLGSALQEAVGSLSRGLSSGSFRNFLGSSSTYPNTQSPSAANTDIKFDDY